MPANDLPDSILNAALLRENVCFGCGHHNAAGLHIELFHDPDRPQALIGRMEPGENAQGFPGIVHGGLIFTALDCLSTWVATLLGPNREAGWVLRSAQVVYQNPALVGQELRLAGWIVRSGGVWESMDIHCEARRPDGAVCVEGSYKVVPLTHERLAGLAGSEALPENWRNFLSSP